MVAKGSPPPECEREAAARKARLEEVWDRVPVRKDGSHDYLAPWVGNRPYWACMLQQAAIETRRGIAEEERAQRVDSAPAIRKAVAASVLPRVSSLSTAHAVMDRRVVDLVRSVQAMPVSRRREEVEDLCERLSSERSLYSQGSGILRLGRFMDCLNRFGKDCDSQGAYTADH